MDILIFIVAMGALIYGADFIIEQSEKIIQPYLSWIERSSPEAKVTGSNPVGCAIFVMGCRLPIQPA